MNWDPNLNSYKYNNKKKKRNDYFDHNPIHCLQIYLI